MSNKKAEYLKKKIRSKCHFQYIPNIFYNFKFEITITMQKFNIHLKSYIKIESD